jgi:hypothetical protein
VLHPVAMSCEIDSPWGDIRFEALTGAQGDQVQLSRDGQVLASDWNQIREWLRRLDALRSVADRVSGL